MTDTISNEPIAPEEAEETAAEKNVLGEILRQVVRRGSNKELALIADNPDQSAEILLVRGDAGEPETYWFHVDGGVMSPLLKDIMLDVLGMDADVLGTDEGLYAYMATAAGIAACFQSSIPGVKLRQAFFCPLDMPLYQFVSATRGWNAHEVVYIKRNRNLAYRYRKACEAIAGGSMATAPARRDTGVPEDAPMTFEQLEYVLNVEADDASDEGLLI